jgi:fumarate hydratase class II
MGQSSNDVIPTAIHVAGAIAITQELMPALEQLGLSLEAKAEQFQNVVKSGRTHMMDATPVLLGQEFAGYAHQVATRWRRDARARRCSSSHWAAAVEPASTAARTSPHRHQVHQRRHRARVLRSLDHFEAQGAGAVVSRRRAR